MKLYQADGYLNSDGIVHSTIPYTFVVGGRGIGKTFGVLKSLLEDGAKFILLRRTQTQADIISKDALSPFKAVCDYIGYRFEQKSIGKYQTGVWFNEEEIPRCYICALSTFSNIRGFDASDIEYLVYDEFIPERHERKIRNEAAAFWNVIETISRNRELTGRSPLHVICLANSTDIANPIFIDLKIVNAVAKMSMSGQEQYNDPRRGLLVCVCNRSPVSAAKQTTSLYRLTQGTEFSDMAVQNKFVNNSFVGGSSRNLREYRPLIQIGEITIYHHKSAQTYYVAPVCIGAPARTYELNDADTIRFQTMETSIFMAYVNRNVIFETPAVELLFLRYFGLS